METTLSSSRRSHILAQALEPVRANGRRRTRRPPCARVRWPCPRRRAEVATIAPRRDCGVAGDERGRRILDVEQAALERAEFGKRGNGLREHDAVGTSGARPSCTPGRFERRLELFAHHVHGPGDDGGLSVVGGEQPAGLRFAPAVQPARHQPRGCEYSLARASTGSRGRRQRRRVVLAVKPSQHGIGELPGALAGAPSWPVPRSERWRRTPARFPSQQLIASRAAGGRATRDRGGRGRPARVRRAARPAGRANAACRTPIPASSGGRAHRGGPSGGRTWCRAARRGGDRHADCGRHRRASVTAGRERVALPGPCSPCGVIRRNIVRPPTGVMRRGAPGDTPRPCAQSRGESSLARRLHRAELDRIAAAGHQSPIRRARHTGRCRSPRTHGAGAEQLDVMPAACRRRPAAGRTRGSGARPGRRGAPSPRASSRGRSSARRWPAPRPAVPPARRRVRVSARASTSAARPSPRGAG